MTEIQTNQHITQQNNQIFMYFQHNILLHATAHIIDEFIPKPFLTIIFKLYCISSLIMVLQNNTMICREISD